MRLRLFACALVTVCCGLGAAPSAGPPGNAPESAPDRLANFVLHRGFFFASDVGVLVGWGGVNSFSNAQPYLSMKAGLDLGDAWSVQGVLAHGYIADNPMSQFDQAGGSAYGGQETSSFSLLAVHGEASYALRPVERLVVAPRLGFGVVRMYPELTVPSNPMATYGPVAPHVVAGVDIEYLTLLTDFSAGASLTEFYVIGPGLSATALSFIVRYTF